ncbi:MAG: glycosyltransferase [Bacteroidia bacterium]|nr:glycosyltransferase [Bacteroidia bacterium]
MQQEYNYTPLPEPIPITEQVWPEGTLPLVCTSTLAYNHEPYIRECLDGILMQKTTFPVQVLVHEDCSTDKTAEILKEYQAKYPNLIKVFYQPENIYSLKDQEEKRKRREEFYSWIIGKYEAICEGDDYWIDPLKLQKQVDFLEANPEYSMCFHNAEVLYDNQASNHIFNKIKKSRKITLKEIIQEWIIPTASIVIKKDSIKNPEWASKIYSGDVILSLMAIKEGEIYFISEIMSIYRKSYNNDSISSKMKDKPEYTLLHYIKILEYYNIEIDFLHYKVLHKEIKYRLMMLKYIKSKKQTSKIIALFLNPCHMLNTILRKLSKHLYWK